MGGVLLKTNDSLPDLLSRLEEEVRSNCTPFLAAQMV